MPYLEAGAKLVVMSHFGRPKGEQNMDMSLPGIPALTITQPTT